MKLQEVFEKINAAVNGEEVRAFAEAYRQYPVKLSFSSYAEGIRYLSDTYKGMGLDAEVVHFPADGKTVYADRHFPYAWDVDEAWAEVDGERIADYEENTYSVVPFSADSNGVCEKPLCAVDDLPAEGSLAPYAAVFYRMPDNADVQALIARGCEVFFSAVDLEPIHPSLDNSRRWYNDLFGVGQLDERDHACVGFSITPRIARMLKARLDAGETVTVKYLMRTRTYEGEAPAATALIHGTEDDNAFFITAHAYEPHATNNVAGVAMSLGAAKALAGLIESGVLPRPKHGIRFFHGLEVFSLYAWGMSHREEMKHAIGGASVDSFGRYGVDKWKEHFVLRRCLNVHPSAQHAVAREALAKVCASRGIDFETREASKNNEEMMQDPQFGPAWNLLYGTLWEEPRETYPRCYFYHTSVDTPDQLSPEMLSGASVYAATLAYYMACDGDAEELSDLALEDWKRIMDDKCREALRLTDTEPALVTLRAQRLAAYRDLALKSGAAAIGDPFKALAFRKYANAKVGAALNVLCGGEPPRFTVSDACPTVIERTMPGPIGLGTLNDELRDRAAEAQGYRVNEYWCLDESGTNIFHFNGKNTVFEVTRNVWCTRPYGVHEDPDEFEKEQRHYRLLGDVLVDGGLARYVEPKPVTKEQIKAGLTKLGLTAGDTVIVHSSLSAFGKVEGGADTVVDALLETVGKNGLLLMPAFTDCTDDGSREAFDAATSAIEPWVGKIPETFRRRPETVRSAHPTHSLAACGAGAEEFLRQSDPADCFAPDGPWTRLRDTGKILILGGVVGGNTFLHACEAWYVGYLDETVARVATPDGERLVPVTNYPSGCRGRWYNLYQNAPYFRKLDEKGIFRRETIGQAECLMCKAADFAAGMKALFTEDPFILLHESGCADCARLKGKVYGK